MNAAKDNLFNRLTTSSLFPFMKINRSHLIYLLPLILLACADKKPASTAEQIPQLSIDTIEIKQDTVIAIIDTIPKEIIWETITEESILFDNFPVKIKPIYKKAPINFRSYKEAKNFITRKKYGYENNEVNFAGYYIGTAFGCGASCIMGFMVDVRDGKIFDLPLGEENMCSWNLDRYISHSDSRLFISSVCKEEENSEEVFYKAYVWKEEKKIFEKGKVEDFIRKKR